MNEPDKDNELPRDSAETMMSPGDDEMSADFSRLQDVEEMTGDEARAAVLRRKRKSDLRDDDEISARPARQLNFQKGPLARAPKKPELGFFDILFSTPLDAKGREVSLSPLERFKQAFNAGRLDANRLMDGAADAWRRLTARQDAEANPYGVLERPSARQNRENDAPDPEPDERVERMSDAGRFAGPEASVDIAPDRSGNRVNSEWVGPDRQVTRVEDRWPLPAPGPQDRAHANATPRLRGPRPDAPATGRSRTTGTTLPAVRADGRSSGKEAGDKGREAARRLLQKHAGTVGRASRRARKAPEDMEM